MMRLATSITSRIAVNTIELTTHVEPNNMAKRVTLSVSINRNALPRKKKVQVDAPQAATRAAEDAGQGDRQQRHEGDTVLPWQYPPFQIQKRPIVGGRFHEAGTLRLLDAEILAQPRPRDEGI